MEEDVQRDFEKLTFLSDEVKSDFTDNFEWSMANKELNATFRHCLKRLAEFASDDENEVLIGNDFAPRSFSFCWTRSGKQMLVGGMILHGEHDRWGDGGGPTFSVSLLGHEGWSLHT